MGMIIKLQQIFFNFLAKSITFLHLFLMNAKLNPFILINPLLSLTHLYLLLHYEHPKYEFS